MLFRLNIWSSVSVYFHFHFLSSNICISSLKEEKTGCVWSANIATDTLCSLKTHPTPLRTYTQCIQFSNEGNSEKFKWKLKAARSIFALAYMRKIEKHLCCREPFSRRPLMPPLHASEQRFCITLEASVSITCYSCGNPPHYWELKPPPISIFIFFFRICFWIYQ